MLTEKATQEELRHYVRLSYQLGRLPKTMRLRYQRAKVHQEPYFVYRTTIPGTDQPVLIIRYTFADLFSPVLVLQGREGEGYGYRARNGYAIIESHAIRRYFNRHEHMDEEKVKTLADIDKDILKRVVYKMLYDMDGANTYSDSLGTTQDCYYEGGIFRVKEEDGVAHFWTYVMNSQAFPDQRMRSLKSEKRYKTLKAKMADKEYLKTAANIETALMLHGL